MRNHHHHHPQKSSKRIKILLRFAGILSFLALVALPLSFLFKFSKSHNEQQQQRQILEQQSFIKTSSSSSCLKAHPVPVVFISKGRSGSTVFWTTLSNLTGYETIAPEYGGRNNNETKEFFSNLTNTALRNGDWVVQNLCDLQQKHPNAHMIGFKWKPAGVWFRPFDEHEGSSSRKDSGAIAAFQRIASEKYIKVIHSHRNPLDVLISNTKHTKSKNQLPSHCNDEICVQQHMSIGAITSLPTGEELIKQMKQSIEMHNRVNHELIKHNKTFLETTYESLFTDKNLDDWQRLLEFVDFHNNDDNNNNKNKVTRELLEVASGRFIKTSSKKQSDLVVNYKDVEATLNSTPYSKFLSG